MKKISFLFCLFTVFVLSACQNELDTNLMENGTSGIPKTRGVSEGFYYEDEQPIYKLLGIPVYIINRGSSNVNGSYLTANSNNTVSLASKDSNKKQKWIIDPYDKDISFVGGGADDTDALVQYGVYSFDTNSSEKYLGIKNKTDVSPSIIEKDDSYRFHQWRFDFRNGYIVNDWFPNGYMKILQDGCTYWWNGFLKANNSNISFSHYSSTDYWEIQPAENFRLDNLTWFLEAEDVIKSLPTFMDQVVVTNNSAITANMTATFARKASETSTFTKSVGSQIQVITSAKVGIPIIASGKIDVNTTTSANWQWGNNETHEDSRTYSFGMTVPAYTSITAKIMVQMNQLSASYVADFVGETSGKHLIISGKWEGVQAGNIYYEIVDNATKNIIKSFSGIPKEAILLNK